MKIREQKEVSILDKTEETQSIVWRIISNMAENIDTKGSVLYTNEAGYGKLSINQYLKICK